MLMRDLFDLYVDLYSKSFTRSNENTVDYWKRYCAPTWAHVELETLNSFAIQRWVNNMGEVRGQPTANRAYWTLAAAISWAMKKGVVTITRNPCKGVDIFKLRSRERFLMPGEIPAFTSALDKESPLLKDFFWMCLLTGARRGNVLAMKWKDIDTELGIWRIPDTEFKTGQSHHLPLTNPALAALQRRKSENPESAFVFPGKGKTGHLSSVKRAWTRVLTHSGIENLRIHDLRRTVGSYMAIAGESQYVIGKTLGHRDPRSTAIYARMDLAPVRRSLENIQNMMLLKGGKL